MLDPQYRTDKTLTKLFSACAEKPIYVTNFRVGFNERLTDEQCVEGLLQALRCGGTMGDVMGDLFNPTPTEINREPESVKRQKEVIDRIHDMGKEVIISSHTKIPMTINEVVELALEYQERGADMVKIVINSLSEEQEMEALQTTRALKKALDVPFLFLCNGSHYKIHRAMGAVFGCAMTLGVHEHDPIHGYNQPRITALRYLLDHFDFTPDRVMLD